MSRPPGAATYLYCLVQSPTAPVPGRAPRGLPGLARPRTVSLGGDLWLIAADAPLARYRADVVNGKLRDLDWVSACAVAHEAVVEHFARASAVVPMKLFTLFTSDARALAHIRRSRPRLARVLARVAGRQEWGVRLVLDAAPARAAARRPAGRAPARAGAGTRFLLGKQAEQAAARRRVAGAGREADRVFRRLRSQAEDARRRPPVESPAGTRLLLDAAFLVPARRAAAFGAAVRAVAARLAGQGYRLTLTGPWPPYSFVGARR